MSKVVISETEIAAPTILKDLLKRLFAKNPVLAKFLENADVVPLIEECAKKALANMKDAEGVLIKSTLYDALQREYIFVEGKKILGVIRYENSRLIVEVAAVIDGDGTIKFASDKHGYTPEHYQKREDLQNLFRHHFLAEAVKAMLPALGYSFTENVKIVVDETTGKETPTIFISAEKQSGGSKKTVDIILTEDGKLTFDFEGFEGDDCSYEEDAFRIFLAKMGVKTNIIHSDNNKEKLTTHNKRLTTHRRN